MVVGFGKYTGRTVEYIVIREPGYIRWMFEEVKADGVLQKVKTEAQRLITRFDIKPFTQNCNAHECHSCASRFSVYIGNCVPFFWCDECDPYQAGAIDGKLRILRSYWDAVGHVRSTCDGTASEYRCLIRSIGAAKGLPDRLSSIALQKFFH